MSAFSLTRNQRRGTGIVLLLLSLVLAGASATKAFADTPVSCTYTISDGQVTISWTGVAADQGGATGQVYGKWLNNVDMGNWTDVEYNQIQTANQGNTLTSGGGTSGSYTTTAAAGADGYSIWTQQGDDLCDNGGGGGSTTTTETPSSSTTEPPSSSTTEPPTSSTTEPPTSSTTEPPTSSTTTPPSSSTTTPPSSSTTSTTTTTLPTGGPSGSVQLDCPNLKYTITLVNPTKSPKNVEIDINGKTTQRTVDSEKTWTEDFSVIEDETYTFAVTFDGVLLDRRTFIVNCDGLSPAKATGSLAYACDTMTAVLTAKNGGQTPVPYDMWSNGVKVKSGTLNFGSVETHTVKLANHTNYDMKVLVGGKELAAAKFTFVCADVSSTTVKGTIAPKVLGASGWRSSDSFDFKQATLAYTGSQTLISIFAGLCFLGSGAMLYSSSKLRDKVSARRS